MLLTNLPTALILVQNNLHSYALGAMFIRQYIENLSAELIDIQSLDAGVLTVHHEPSWKLQTRNLMFVIDVQFVAPISVVVTAGSKRAALGCKRCISCT